MRTKNVLLATAFLLVGSLTADAATTSGAITNAETWSGTVLLKGDVTVTPSGSLTILPGTRVECDPRGDDQIGGLHTSRIELIVNEGTLTAVGTAVSPITFTAGILSTNPPQPGDWYGIRLNTTNATLRQCIVEYGKESLRVEGGSAVLESCTFRASEGSGVSFTVSGSLTDCLMAENGTGVTVGAGTFVLTGCTLTNNSGSGIRLDSSTVTMLATKVVGNAGSGLEGPGGTVVLGQDSEVGGNKSDGINVGGLDLTMTDSVIRANGGAGVFGSGITARVTRSAITGNGWRGIQAGWQAYGASATITLENSSISQNGGHGIGVSAIQDSRFSVTALDSTISDNGGGGITAEDNRLTSFRSGDILVSGSTVNNNVGGAGILTTVGCNGTSSIIVTNSSVSNNAGAGVVLINNIDGCGGTGAVAIRASTVAQNGGGGVSTGIGPIAVADSIISLNRGGIGIELSEVAPPGLTNNLIYGNDIGIVVNSSAPAVDGIVCNDIFGNRDYELKNVGPAAVVADGNYWGEPTTTELSNHVVNLTKVYDSRDDANVGQVVIHDWSPTNLVPAITPIIVSQPLSRSAFAGADVTFSVFAIGTVPMTYQWQKGATPLSWATNSSLVLTNVSVDDSGIYSVVVSNSAGSVTSSPATLTVNPIPVPQVSLSMYAGLTIQGTVGQTYRIQGTPDLVQTNTWLDLADVLMTDASQLWFDVQSPGYQRRFYRVILP